MRNHDEQCDPVIDPEQPLIEGLAPFVLVGLVTDHSAPVSDCDSQFGVLPFSK